MYLEKEEERMLKGAYGPALELAMKVIVKMGDSLEAEKLVPIVSSHVGNAGFLRRLNAYVGVVKELSRYGAQVKVMTSENPYPYDKKRVEELGVPKPFKGMNPLEKYYRKLGVTPTWTCTPYLYGNIPIFGQHLSWEESSAVAYVNSVLGARTNREPILMDIASAIVGRTLYYGLHLDENRRGEILYTIRKERLSDSDYPAIGYYIGKTTETKVPVIDGRLRGVSSNNLKSLGAAAASSGPIALFHVIGVTPEARTSEDAFKKEKPIDRIDIGPREIEETKEEMSSLEEEKIELITVGCPHYSIEEVAKVARMLYGKKIKKGVQFWICTHEGSRILAKELGYYDVIEASGARVITGCPTFLSLTPLYRRMSLMTDSGKTCYYRDAVYGSTEDCVKSAIEGRVVRQGRW